MHRKTKTELTIQTLIRKGHISEATGHAEHGRYRVADAIHRLRTSERHLVPAGMEIVTLPKEDSNGNRYGEWALRKKAA